MSEYRKYDDEWLLYSDNYIKHVSAMTGEKLHSKADIAAELAYRDDLIEQLQQRNAELESELRSHKQCIEGVQQERDELAATVERLRLAIMSNCYDDPSASGKRLMELTQATPQANLNAIKREVARELLRWLLDKSDDSDHESDSKAVDYVNTKYPTTEGE